jgi:hypothetical protein
VLPAAHPCPILRAPLRDSQCHRRVERSRRAKACPRNASETPMLNSIAKGYWQALRGRPLFWSTQGTPIRYRARHSAALNVISVWRGLFLSARHRATTARIPGGECASRSPGASRIIAKSRHKLRAIAPIPPGIGDES